VLQNKVVVAHQNQVSPDLVTINIRERLDYGLSYLSHQEGGILSVPLKDFIGMLLQARQLGRSADDERWEKVPIHPGSHRYRLFWSGRPISGIELEAFGAETGVKANSRVCIYGCVNSDGHHQWLSGTK
jgi:hypothetical protein